MMKNPPSIGLTIIVIVVLLVGGPLLLLSFGLLRLLLAPVYSLMVGGDLNFNRWIEYGAWRERKLEPWISKLGLQRVDEAPGVLEALQAIPAEKHDHLHVVGIERMFSTSIAGLAACVVDVSRRGKVVETEVWASVVEFFLPRSWTLATGNDLERITVVAVRIARIGHPRCNVKRAKVSEELEIERMPETILTAEQKKVLDGYPMESFERIAAHEDWLLFCSPAMSPARSLPWMLENTQAFLTLRQTGEIPDELRTRNRNRIRLQLPPLGQPIVTSIFLIGALVLGVLALDREMPWFEQIAFASAGGLCGLATFISALVFVRWVLRRNRVRDEDPSLVET